MDKALEKEQAGVIVMGEAEQDMEEQEETYQQNLMAEDQLIAHH